MITPFHIKPETLFRTDRRKVESLGKAAPPALKVYNLLRQRVIVSPVSAAQALEITWPTTMAAIHRLEDLGIAREITGKKRGRLYLYSKQLRLLDEGVAD